jgi:hypothetical protein
MSRQGNTAALSSLASGTLAHVSYFAFVNFLEEIYVPSHLTYFLYGSDAMFNFV